MSKTNYLWLTVLLLLFSCSDDDCNTNDLDYDGVNDVIDNCISKEMEENVELVDVCTGCIKKTDIKTTVTEKIRKLKIYLEISGSMKGYMPKQNGKSTEFQQKMASLFSWFVTSATADTKQFYGIKDDKTTLEYESKDDVASKISRSDFSFGATTTLPDLIENVINENGKEDVSIIVSDFLYSPPSILNLEGTLNVKLREMFLKNPDMALSVYAFKSDFEGKFYTVSNKTVLNCCSDKRPYYVWVLGKQALVEQIDKLINDKNIGFLEELHIGKKYETIYGEIMPLSGRDSEAYWQRSADCKNIITGAEVSEEEPLKYTIGINLKDLPKMYKRKEYLMNNFEVNSGESASRIKSIKTYSEFEKSINEGEVRLSQQYTHFIEIETVSVSVPCRADLKLELKSNLPNWIDKWNTESDETDADRNEKTVLLKRVFSGINEAYENKILFSYSYIVTSSNL